MANLDSAQSGWKKGQEWALVALVVVIALFVFCLFFFGSRV